VSGLSSTKRTSTFAAGVRVVLHVASVCRAEFDLVECLGIDERERVAIVVAEFQRALVVGITSIVSVDAKALVEGLPYADCAS